MGDHLKILSTLNLFEPKEVVMDHVDVVKQLLARVYGKKEVIPLLNQSF